MGCLFKRRRHGTLINRTTKCIFQRSCLSVFVVCVCMTLRADCFGFVHRVFVAVFSLSGLLYNIAFQCACVYIVLSFTHILPRSEFGRRARAFIIRAPSSVCRCFQMLFIHKFVSFFVPILFDTNETEKLSPHCLSLC